MKIEPRYAVTPPGDHKLLQNKVKTNTISPSTNKFTISDADNQHNLTTPIEINNQFPSTIVPASLEISVTENSEFVQKELETNDSINYKSLTTDNNQKIKSVIKNEETVPITVSNLAKLSTAQEAKTKELYPIPTTNKILKNVDTRNRKKVDASDKINNNDIQSAYISPILTRFDGYVPTTITSYDRNVQSGPKFYPAKHPLIVLNARNNNLTENVYNVPENYTSHLIYSFSFALIFCVCLVSILFWLLKPSQKRKFWSSSKSRKLVDYTGPRKPAILSYESEIKAYHFHSPFCQSRPPTILSVDIEAMDGGNLNQAYVDIPNIHPMTATKQDASSAISIYSEKKAISKVILKKIDSRVFIPPLPDNKRNDTLPYSNCSTAN